MPATLTLRLAGPVRRPGPRQLQGAAAALFEDSASDHHAAVKPFAVGPLLWTSGPAATATWRLGWLGAGSMPSHWPPTAVRFGPSHHEVLGFGGDTWTFAGLSAAAPIRRVRLRTLTPMFFSRSGRDLPLPDPVLVFRSLIERWNTLAPSDFRIDGTASRELLGAVFLGKMHGGTERVALADQLTQVGFVGGVELGLLRSAPVECASLFAALTQFATVAGIGAQTTHGFGAVEFWPAETVAFE